MTTTVKRSNRIVRTAEVYAQHRAISSERHKLVAYRVTTTETVESIRDGKPVGKASVNEKCLTGIATAAAVTDFLSGTACFDLDIFGLSAGGAAYFTDYNQSRTDDADDEEENTDE